MKLLNKIGKAELKLLKEIYGDKYEEALEKVNNHYPIQYLIGYVDFYNTRIKVNENVLIPRYETEVLVDIIVKTVKNHSYLDFVDICTGSGCIAISLTKTLSNIAMDAVDISEKALEVAKENALENKVEINFWQKDILKEELSKKYDVIVSNPPYVKINEDIGEEVEFEPKIALYANDNGLEFYKRIFKMAKKILKPKGMIFLEIGATLGEEIKKEALEIFPKALVTILKDYNGLDRFLILENISF